MDNKFIKKIIERVEVRDSSVSKYSNCEHPLLHKGVADLLAQELMKILKSSNNDDQTKHLILENIRKSCNIKPINHVYFDDNMTEVLKNVYQELPDNNSIDKALETFSIRYLKEININSIHSSYFKPDIIQALLNLSNDKKKVNDILMKDIIYWNADDNGYLDILNKLWNVEFIEGFSNQPDDISIKMKAQIENILLCAAFENIETVHCDKDWFYENKALMQLIEICCVSRECFQICCSIMNTIFIKTKFDNQMSQFIYLFIDSIYKKVENISTLYSTDLQYIVVLLDIHFKDFTEEGKKMYISFTKEHLENLHKECESDLIMLLSHFKQWFKIYEDLINNRME